MSKLIIIIVCWLSLEFDINEARVVKHINHRFVNTQEGVVVSNAEGCAEIGKLIMKKGGNVIDTVIATAFCEGVVNPTTMGLGGGFMATIFNKTTGKVFSVNARETAPAAAKEDMFVNNQSLSALGGLSVAIPSELKGYWYLYKNYGGKVPWRELVEPTIKMCSRGILMNDLTYRNARTTIDMVRADPGLKAIFIDPKTDDVYKYGEFYRRPKLANTLKIIASEGGLALYKGTLTKNFVKDIQDKGGIVTAKDLQDYELEILEPVHTEVLEKDIYSHPLPASGPLLIYVMNVLENFLDSKVPISSKNAQRFVETLKFAYGQRSKLGDGNFVDLDSDIKRLVSKDFAAKTRAKIQDNKTFNDPEHYGMHTQTRADHGTANICVWAPNGDGISLTSSINYIFGAGIASKSTDIILNNSMDDFSSPGITNVYGIPPSPSNFIRPGKRPMSSMAPSIILDKQGDLFMIIGGAGGSKITSSVSEVLANRLYFDMDIRTASDSKRMHHQLLPMILYLEDGWLTTEETIVQDLLSYGHNISYTYADGFNAVTGISKDESAKTGLVGVFDKRRTGSVAYLSHY